MKGKTGPPELLRALAARHKRGPRDGGRVAAYVRAKQLVLERPKSETVGQALERLAVEMGLDPTRLWDTCRGKNSSVRRFEARQRKLLLEGIEALKSHTDFVLEVS